MTPVRALFAALLMAMAFCCAPRPAAATSVPLNTLGNRGNLVCTDELPDLPSGGATLEQVTGCQLKAFIVGSIDNYGADPTGATDSTAAIQAALNAGGRLYCAGTYKVSATLTLTAEAQAGLILSGSGATDNLGVGAGKCIIRPTSALAGAVFTIDGTPFSGFIEGVGFENLTVDMTNMSDVATNIAFNQVQAFDAHYRGVRVINYGVHKLSWNFSAGAYTSTVQDSQGGIVNFAGVSGYNAATTISLNNVDILSLTHNYYQNTTITGGAIQQPYYSGMKIVYVPPGTVGYALGQNTAGFYGAVMTEISNSLQFTSVGADWEQGGGYPSTYNDGTHGTLNLYPIVLIDSTSINTTFIAPTFAGCYLVDYGVATNVVAQGQSGVTGMTITTGFQVDTGSRQEAGTVYGISSFYGTASGSPQTYSLVGSTGVGNFFDVAIKPGTDGNVFSLAKANGTGLEVCSSSGLYCVFENSMAIAGYSDSFTTLAWQLSVPGAGNGELQIYGSGTPNIILLGGNGTIQANGGLTATPVGSVTPSTGQFTTLAASTGVYIGASGGHLLCSATAPTVSSGFGTSPSIASNNGTCSFRVNVGTGGTATSGVIGLPAATTAWVCMAEDLTTTSSTVFMTKQTASSTTSATFGNFNTSGAAAAWAASDVLGVQCQAN